MDEIENVNLELPENIKFETDLRARILFDEFAKEVFKDIVNAPWFPFRTGNLKWNATRQFILDTAFAIDFNPNKAHYIDFLEYGTKPHLIPNAFGRGITVKHPGSRKHVDFIQKKSVDRAIQTIIEITGGKLVK